MFFPTLTVVSGFFLARMILITLGVLKGPVLRMFERYGDDEPYYDALPRLLLWVGLFTVSSGTLLANLVPSSILPLVMMGFLMFIGAYAAYELPDLTRKYFRYPVWYVELLERTSRAERRRIAYMWRLLSRKARVAYSSNNHWFNEWADLIIVSTLHP
jgi:hypothetical protein